MSTFNHLKAYLRQRVREWLSGLAKQVLAQPRLAVIAQKLVIDRKYRLNIGHPERVVILLAGCGGTGSFVAHILAQLACWAKTANIDMRLYFIDPDIVEQRNLVRQNFCPTDAFVADNSEICFAQIGILINNVNETTSIGNWLKYS